MLRGHWVARVLPICSSQIKTPNRNDSIRRIYDHSGSIGGGSNQFGNRVCQEVYEAETGKTRPRLRQEQLHRRANRGGNKREEREEGQVASVFQPVLIDC